MNRTGVKARLIIGIAAAALLIAALALMLWNCVPTAGMDHVEINGRVISISGGKWNYRADIPLLKGGVTEGVLVMNNGSEYSIKYIDDYDAFTIKDRFGFYEMKEA